MYDFKIDNFKNTYPEGEFPHFYTLSGEETQTLSRLIRERFEEKSGPPASRSNLEFLSSLHSQSKLVRDYNACNQSFSLIELLSSLNIPVTDSVFINWDDFSNIDEVALLDLDRYFDDIWYASADDIEIISGNILWILMVRHDGNIRYLSNKSSSE